MAEPSKDQVLPVKINGVYLYTACEQVIETGSDNTNLQWVFDDTVGAEKFTVTYKGADPDATATDDDVVIEIALANIGTTSETWTAFGSDHLLPDMTQTEMK